MCLKLPRDRPNLRRDRLSAVIAALRPVATVCAVDDPAAQFVLTPTRLVLRLRSGFPPEPGSIVAARLDSILPLAQTLCSAPDRLEIALDDCPDLAALAAVLASEADAHRCGAPHAMARLVEAMLVIALRRAVDAAPPASGLLAGLSHPRIGRWSRSTSVPERPGRSRCWRPRRECRGRASWRVSPRRSGSAPWPMSRDGAWDLRGTRWRGASP